MRYGLFSRTAFLPLLRWEKMGKRGTIWDKIENSFSILMDYQKTVAILVFVRYNSIKRIAEVRLRGLGSDPQPEAMRMTVPSTQQYNCAQNTL